VFANVTVDASPNTLYRTFSAFRPPLPALASHIHGGGATVAGPVVVLFTAPEANS
jgi:hypothetical protein